MSDQLIFRLNKKFFSIDTGRVYGIIEAKDIYFLPGRRGFVKGVISLRGQTITVVDSSVLSGSAGADSAAPGKIIVIKDQDRYLGIDISTAEINFSWGRTKPSPTADDKSAPPQPAVPPGETIEEVPSETVFSLTEKILSPGRRKVLIADDMEFYRHAVREVLSAGGFHVMAEACNGREAVELTLRHKPEIIILDIVMPEKNGIDAAREIKALPFAPKIIICSSLDDKDIKEEAKNAGADAYITKPFTSTGFLSTLLDTI